LGAVVKEVEEKARLPRTVIEREVPKKELISTGSTLLNLALSDYPYGGYRPGRIVNLIGDSSSGKTLLCLAMFAEIAQMSKYDKYEFLYMEPEAGMEFDIADMFGSKIMSRINFLPTDRSKPCTVQDWYNSIFDAIVTRKKPCIHVLDSFDALTSKEEIEDHEVGKGGYKTEKAIASSAALRQVANVNEGTQSLMLIISQTRQNLGAMFGKKKTRSGGDALHFFSTQEIWLHNGPKITKKSRGDDIEIGRYVLVDVAKNRVTGKRRKVKFPVLDGYGVDDIRSMVEWLAEKGFWEKEGKSVDAWKIDTCNDFEVNGKVVEIVKYIEDNNLEDKLKKIVWDCWMEIEDELKIDRKRRYE
jgi:RecA/RadA recombinase